MISRLIVPSQIFQCDPIRSGSPQHELLPRLLAAAEQGKN
jgi:hypothetical protein